MITIFGTIKLVYTELLLFPFYKRTWISIGYLDILQVYRRSFLGPIWITLSIAIQAISVTYIYSQLFSSGAGKEYYAYVVCGLIAWTWISSLLTDMGNVFLAYAGYIKTSNINISQFIWAMAWKHTIIFLHNLVLWFIYFLFGAIVVNVNSLYILITFPIIFLLSIPVIGLLGILFARYRDFSRLVSSMITLLLIVTPIFWMSNQLTGVRTLLYKINPFYYLVESLRAPLMGNPISEHTWWALLIMFLISWIICASIYICKLKKLVFWI